MQRGLVVLWILLVKHALVCEALCDDEAGHCFADTKSLSLADVSYVPDHRLLKHAISNDNGDKQVVRDDSLNNEEKKRVAENQYLHSPTGSELVMENGTKHENMEGRMSPSEESVRTQAPSGHDAVLETIREFSRGTARMHDDDDHDEENTEEDHHEEEEHGDPDHDGESAEEDHHEEEEHGEADHHEHDGGHGDEACSNVERSWDEYCYFLTKEPVPGYRSATECSKAFPDAEFAEIHNDEANTMVSEYVRQLDETSGKPLHLQILYVYIKDDEEASEYRATRLNPREEQFKQSICDVVGCPCMALRSTTGSWHRRICDTRHYALCRRPHHHPGEEVSTEAAVTGPVDKEDSSTGARVAAPLPLLVLMMMVPSVVVPLSPAGRGSVRG